MLRPRRLSRGSRIAVVAPASAFRRDDLDKGVAELSRLGFEAVWEPSVFERKAYLAGTADVRAGAITRALKDPEIAALIAVRGGIWERPVASAARAGADPQRGKANHRL
jgi:muramoyltetrapeptide carboxypeptidase